MTRTPVRCPACSAPTSIVNVGPLALEMCSGCSGLWFDRQALQAAASAPSTEQLADDLQALLAALYKGSERTGKVYLSCPVCHELLNRRTYAIASGVQVSRCEAHGTWVDRLVATRLARLMRGEADADLLALEPENDGATRDAHSRLRRVLELFDFL